MAVVVALVAISAVIVRVAVLGLGGCAGGIALRVQTTPELKPVLAQIAAKWQDRDPQVEGECVNLTVTAQDSATVASDLTVFAGGGIDVAAAPRPTPSEDALPSVWVPDSTAWLLRVQAVDRGAFLPQAQSIASSPIVIAMPSAVATAVGKAAGGSGRLPLAAIPDLLNAGGPLKLGVAEPRRDSASLAAIMALGSVLAPTNAQLPALVGTMRGLVKTGSTDDLLAGLGGTATAGPASEQSVLAHNASSSPVKLATVQLDPPLPQLDYPYAIRASVSRQVAQAAEQFRTEVQSADSAAAFAAAGFRTPDGRVGPQFPSSPGISRDRFAGGAIGDAAGVQRWLSLWAAAQAASRTLAVFDVTSSMGTTLPGSGQPRAALMVAAAQEGIALFTGESLVGMWVFGAEHQEVMPIAVLSPEKRQAVATNLASAKLSGSNHAELYTTMLDAYKKMASEYDPTRPNIIVIMTDGGDSNPGGQRLEKFRQDVQRYTDPTRPITVVLIGIGVSPDDAQDLQAVAGIVGGSYFPLTNPDQITGIFLNALLKVGPA
jgi:hypothetical protein